MMLSIEEGKPFIRRPYRFEAMWILHPGCKEILRKAWCNAIQRSPSFILANKLKLANYELKVWNKNTSGDHTKRKRALENDLT